MCPETEKTKTVSKIATKHIIKSKGNKTGLEKFLCRENNSEHTLLGGEDQHDTVKGRVGRCHTFCIA
jgi:hypothetical protein